jgi:hypothetical protein
MLKRFGFFIWFSIAVGLVTTHCSETSRPTEPVKSALAAKSTQAAKSVPAEKSTTGKKSVPEESKYPPLEARDHLSDQPSEENQRKTGSFRYYGNRVIGPTGIVKVVSRRRIGGKGRFRRSVLDRAIDRLREVMSICYKGGP